MSRHIPLNVARPRHAIRTRSTHEANAFEGPLVSAEPAQRHEAEIDHLVGNQDLIDGAVTLPKMRLEDEFGATVLTPSGFQGSWEDTVLTGIYNGAFNDNNSSGIDLLIEGRTIYVPYWSIDLSGGVTATSQLGGVSAKIYGAGHSFVLKSDPVKVRQGMRYRVLLIDRFHTSNDIVRTVSVNRFERGTQVDIVGLDSETITTTLAIGIRDCGSFKSSDTPSEVLAETTEVEINISYEWGGSGTNSSANAVTVYEVMLIPEPYTEAQRFPTDPTSGQRHHRADLGMEFFFNGTHWLSATLFEVALLPLNTTWPFSASTGRGLRMATPPLKGGSDIWVEDMKTTFFVSGGTALGASHKWVGQLSKVPTGNTDTSVGSAVNIDSGASSVWRESSQVIDALLNNGTIHYEFGGTWTKTGTPGNLFVYTNLTYRIVAT